ncbi:MAG: rhomboid family intramembrane serine protease [Phycisphaerae bacterium]|nr:rhomboid family intramembrane serine protease [Phycisphaerae bacterium]
MIIPIHTDYKRQHTPWMNYLIVAVNILLFVLGYNASSPAHSARIAEWMLQPDQPMMVQFFSSMFLHASIAHLLGNMVFLWVFGNAVNDKFGQAGYLAFYLAGGLLAGIGYLVLSGSAPVLGASGAIAAVAGAYLVLLPRTTITLLVLLFYVFIPWEVSSLYFILIQFVFEIFMTAKGFAGPASGGIAYAAHASGYLFGIAVSFLVLRIQALPRDDYDLIHLLRDYVRRRKFKKLVAAGYDPFRHPTVFGDMEKTDDAPVTSPPEQELRDNIARAITAHDIKQGVKQYGLLEAMVENPVLPRTQQLDIANQMMADNQYKSAARAYERFVEHNPKYDEIGDIYLLLGLLYGRYLKQYQKAAAVLELATMHLHDEKKIALVNTELAAANRQLDKFK